jgi:hypothetical protein
MPVCVDCHKLASPSVSGYDAKWRCLACNQLHAAAVLRESGDSAPNASEHRPGVPITHDEAKEKKRQTHAKRMLEKYGVAQKNRWS